MPTNIDLSFAGETALEASRSATIPNGIYSTGYNQGVIEGDVVKVDTLGAQTPAAAWNDSTRNYATETVTTEGFTDVTLNQRYLSQFTLTSDQWLRIGQAGFDARLRAAVSESMRQVNVNVMSLITAVNYSTAVHTGVASTLDVDAIGVINTNADIQKWTVKEDRKMVLTGAYYNNIITEPAIINLNQRGDASANRMGRLSNDVLGWDIYELDTIPANAENLTGFVTDGRGIAVAYGVKSDWSEKTGYFSEVFFDAESNFAYRLNVQEALGTHNKTFTVETLYGFAKGQANALKRIVSA